MDFLIQSFYSPIIKTETKQEMLAIKSERPPKSKRSMKANPRIALLRLQLQSLNLYTPISTIEIKIK